MLQSDPDSNETEVWGMWDRIGQETQWSGDLSYGEKPGDMGTGVDRTRLVSCDLCLGRGLLCDGDADTHPQVSPQW